MDSYTTAVVSGALVALTLTCVAKQVATGLGLLCRDIAAVHACYRWLAAITEGVFRMTNGAA